MIRPSLCALALLITGLAQASALPEPLPPGSPNAPVATLDLDRYSGTWHEVARLPMFFQRNCIKDTTATYTRQENGRVKVRNACREEDGGLIEVVGEARTTDVAGGLEVRFAPAWLGWIPAVWADYWIIDLDPDYQWAVVGGPGKGALWVLYREPSIPADLLERLRQRAEARGYALSTLIVAAAP